MKARSHANFGSNVANGRLLATGSLIAMAMVYGTSAQANCTPSGTVPNGSTVVCVGTTNTPIVIDGDQLAVEVQSGDTLDNPVSLPAPLVEITGDNNAFVNDGTINYDGTDLAVRLVNTAGGDLALTNNGMLTSTSAGVELDATAADVAVINDGTISSVGTGILTRASTSGNVMVHNSANGVVEAQGPGVIAIFAHAEGGAVDVTNAGDIQQSFIGIGVSAVTGLEILNSGNIGTASDRAGFGILGDVVFGSGVTANITNSGSIFSGAYGVNLLLGDGSTMNFVNSGTVSNRGGGSARAVQFFTNTARSNVAVNIVNQAGGVIESSGGTAGAIDVAIIGDATVAISNAGIVRTAGLESIAIEIDIDAGDISLLNTGSISTIGTFSDAVLADSGLGNIDLTNSASGYIQTTRNGLRADGGGNSILLNEGTINVRGLGAGFATTVDGTANLTNRGTITTDGQGSRGFSANTMGDATLTNEGTVDVVGDGTGTRGLSSNVTGVGSNNSLTNAVGGIILVDGHDGVQGITSMVADGTSTIANLGSLTVSGSGAEGIQAFANIVEVTNSGSIVADNGANSGITVTGGLGATGRSYSISNSGSIVSDQTGIFVFGRTGGEVATINSSGLLEGGTSSIVTSFTSDVVTLSGMTAGDVFLEDFDDSLTFSGSGADNFTGLLNGGDGNDTLVFSGTSTVAFDQAITNFETISVTGSLRTGNLTIGGLQSFTVENGAVLSLEVDTLLDLGSGDFIALDGSRILLDIDARNPQISTTGNASLAQDSQIEINVLDLDSLVSGNSFDAVVAGGSVTDNSADIIDNSLLFDFEKVIAGGNTLQIVTRQIVMIDDAVDQDDIGLVNVAIALQAIVDGGGIVGSDLGTRFGQLADDASVSQAAQQFVPDDSGASMALQSHGVRAIADAIFTNQMLRTETASGWSIWGHGLINDVDGDAIDFTSAFDGDQRGFAFGIDKKFGDEGQSFLLGAAYYGINSDYAVVAPALLSGNVDLNGFVFLVRRCWVVGAYTARSPSGLPISRQTERTTFSIRSRRAKLTPTRPR